MQHFLNAVRMHVSEVVLYKIYTAIFHESKFQLQTFLSLSSFVTELKLCNFCTVLKVV